MAKREFGLISLAYTVTAVLAGIQELGVRQVLIQRQRSLRLWINPAFWLCLASGIGIGLLTAASAPIAAVIYGEPAVTPILLVLALVMPLEALRAVPAASLTAQLRFGASALSGTAHLALTTLGTLILAWQGQGAMSFPLGRLAGIIPTLMLLWLMTRPRIRLNPQALRWRFLLADGMLVVGAGLSYRLVLQGDYMMLGLLYPAEVVGLYFFAFTLASQTFSLFTLGLAGVLFPVFAKMDKDVRRQTQACIRAASTLAVITVPVCLLQVLAAPAFILLIYGEKWSEAILLFQILSIGLIFRVVYSPLGSLLLSQRRLWLNLIQNIIHAFAYMLAAFVGGWWWGAPGTALAVSLYLMIAMPSFFLSAIRQGSGTFRDVLNILAKPLAGSVGAAIVAAICLGMLRLHPTASGHIVHLAIVWGIGILVYLALMRWWASESLWLLVQHLPKQIRNHWMVRLMIGNPRRVSAPSPEVLS